MLKVLMLNAEITSLRSQLVPLEQARDGFAAREAELERDIAEASTDEERSVVSAAVDTFEEERNANAAEIERIQGEIDARTAQIQALEARQARQPAEPSSTVPNNTNNERSIPMPTTERRWFGLTYEQRDELLTRETTKTFLTRVRELRAQQSSASGAELGIPTEFMPILRDETYNHSKLWQYVHHDELHGRARQNIAGTPSDAIWTEAVANINEIVLDFTQLEMEAYMLAGYMALPNGVLEDDSDLRLMTSIIAAMGESNGRALDKAIVYGTGFKMPVGFVTRLAAASKPSWWGTDQGDFNALNTSNVLRLNIDTTSGTAFFSTLIEALGVADPKLSDGKAVWVMNRKTHVRIMAKALAFDSSAALVASATNTMPVIGGDIVELDFMSDNDIAGGFLSLQRMVERDGAAIAASDLPLFLRNMTAFRSVGRYDGKPARGEGFVLINFSNTAPKTVLSFNADLANTAIGTLIVSTAASTSGKTTVTVAGNGSGALKYMIGGQAQPVESGARLGSDWKALPANKIVEAANKSTITVVEVNSEGRAIAAGSGSVTAG